MKNVLLMMAGMVIMFTLTMAVAWIFNQQGVVWLRESMPLLCCGFGTSVSTICVLTLIKELKNEKKEVKETQKQKVRA